MQYQRALWVNRFLKVVPAPELSCMKCATCRGAASRTNTGTLFEGHSTDFFSDAVATLLGPRQEIEEAQTQIQTRQHCMSPVEKLPPLSICLQDAAGHKATGNTQGDCPGLWVLANSSRRLGRALRVPIQVVPGLPSMKERTRDAAINDMRGPKKPHGKDHLCQITEEKPDTAARLVGFDTRWWLACS